MIRSLCVAATLSLAGSASAQLFQPDSAIAGSEFSGSYLIENTINGTGLPAGFDVNSEHSTYVQGNHWTTRSGALNAGNAWAEFSFDTPVTIQRLHMWNHLSNGVASDPGYAVTEFNISFLDASDDLITEALGVTALPDVFVAQTFDFGLMNGVSKVRFEIVANNGSPQYTGLAEVAFDAVPAPAAASLLALAGLGAAQRRR